MELTRRDAVAALLTGAGAWAGAVGLPAMDGRPVPDRPEGLREDGRRTLGAVAEVVYPSEVTATREFVEQYVAGLPERRQRDVAVATAALDRYARRTRGDSFSTLSPPERDSVLRSMGVDRVGSSPDGTLPERVRYHVVNQLLYALYTTPKGSRLLGIENPVGFSGGYESYQKPPSGASRSARRTADTTGGVDEQ